MIEPLAAAGANVVICARNAEEVEAKAADSTGREPESVDDLLTIPREAHADHVPTLVWISGWSLS